jgi:predicted enzyme related to lactoylglutathione lyase
MDGCRLTDPEAARTFYTEVFGYHYQAMPGAPGDYLTFHLSEAPLGGMGGMMDPSDVSPSHWVAYFSVADTDAAVAAAVGGGGALQGTPMDTPFGRMAFLTDPDGAVFALAGPRPTA